MAMLPESYESLGVIASALYGDVYKLRHCATGELAALKRMDLVSASRRRTKDTNRPIEEDVFTEVQINLALRKLGGHKHVVAMRDAFADETSVSLLTEFCGKGELLEVVNARGTLLPVHDVMRYFYQILKGVAFLHMHGIAHRDLSLENVLVDDQDCCKLSDFGMATTAKRMRATGIGKVHYMAPEACKEPEESVAGSIYNPFRADIWSLGVILSTLLTGQYPFSHALESDAHFRLLSTFGVEYVLARCDFNTEGFEDIVDLLNHMLVVDPASRASAQELLLHECFDEFLFHEDDDDIFDKVFEPADEILGDDTTTESDSIESEDEVGEGDVDPALDDYEQEEESIKNEVITITPQSCGSVLFTLRRPSPIDTTGLGSKPSCTFVVSSRRSPALLKEQRVTGGPSNISSTGHGRAVRRSPRYIKKCIFRGMLEGVFRRKRAHSSAPSALALTPPRPAPATARR